MHGNTSAHNASRSFHTQTVRPLLTDGEIEDCRGAEICEILSACVNIKEYQGISGDIKRYQGISGDFYVKVSPGRNKKERRWRLRKMIMMSVTS